MHRHFSRKLNRFHQTQNLNNPQGIPTDNNTDPYSSESTLSSDEAINYIFKRPQIGIEESMEVIVDTLDGPSDNGTDTIVCSNCVKVFRGKYAYDKHKCKS